jgi:hypothetical protein
MFDVRRCSDLTTRMDVDELVNTGICSTCPEHVPENRDQTAIFLYKGTASSALLRMDTTSNQPFLRAVSFSISFILPTTCPLRITRKIYKFSVSSATSASTHDFLALIFENTSMLRSQHFTISTAGVQSHHTLRTRRTQYGSTRIPATPLSYEGDSGQ